MRSSVSLTLLLASGCTDSTLGVRNSPPTVALVSHLDGDEVVAGAAVTLEAIVGDDNDGPAQLDVAWRVDGAEVCPSVVPQGGRVECGATFVVGGGVVDVSVSDPKGASATARVTLSVRPDDSDENEPPAVVITAPDDGSTAWLGDPVALAATVSDDATAASTLTVAVRSDLDGEVATPLAGGDGAVSASLSLSLGVHTLTVTAADEEGAVGSDTVQVTVSDPGEAPVVTAVDITPEAPLAGLDDLVCEASATDPDATTPALGFAWSVDGSPYTGGTTATSWPGDTVPAGSTQHGETWTCTVTATDGVFESEPLSHTTDVVCFGHDASCPAPDCASILAELSGAPSGTWWVDPDGAGAFETWCDQHTDGGGWTLAASFVNSDGATSWAASSTASASAREDHPGALVVWRTDAPFGALASHTTADYRGPAWSRLDASDVLLVNEDGDWLTYAGLLTGEDLFAALTAVTDCQSALEPTTATRGSNSVNAGSAVMAFYGDDPNHLQTCAMDAYANTSSAVMATYVEGCGTYGLGSQVASGAVDTMVCLGLDHRLADSTCGAWNGQPSVLRSNGCSDDLTLLYVR